MFSKKDFKHILSIFLSIFNYFIVYISILRLAVRLTDDRTTKSQVQDAVPFQWPAVR